MTMSLFGDEPKPKRATPYELACAALTENRVPSALSSIFLGGFQMGYDLGATSKVAPERLCPVHPAGVYGHEWLKAFAMGKEAAAA